MTNAGADWGSIIARARSTDLAVRDASYFDSWQHLMDKLNTLALGSGSAFEQMEQIGLANLISTRDFVMATRARKTRNVIFHKNENERDRKAYEQLTSEEVVELVDWMHRFCTAGAEAPPCETTEPSSERPRPVAPASALLQDDAGTRLPSNASPADVPHQDATAPQFDSPRSSLSRSASNPPDSLHEPRGLSPAASQTGLVSLTANRSIGGVPTTRCQHGLQPSVVLLKARPSTPTATTVTLAILLVALSLVAILVGGYAFFGTQSHPTQPAPVVNVPAQPVLTLPKCADKIAKCKAFAKRLNEDPSPCDGIDEQCIKEPEVVRP